MQLIQTVLQLLLVSRAVAGSAVDEASGPVPGLLPPPGRVQPARLEHRAHVAKKLLLETLHALLHLQAQLLSLWRSPESLMQFFTMQW